MLLEDIVDLQRGRWCDECHTFQVNIRLPETFDDALDYAGCNICVSLPQAFPPEPDAKATLERAELERLGACADLDTQVFDSFTPGGANLMEPIKGVVSLLEIEGEVESTLGVEDG